LLLGIDGLALTAVEIDQGDGGRVVQGVTDDEGATSSPDPA